MRRPLEAAQHASITYTERLAEAGIAPSVGSPGDSYDNALAETVIGLFKAEVVRRLGPWRPLEAVELATLAWVNWLDHRRLLEPIGFVPPPGPGRSRLLRRSGERACGRVGPKPTSLRQTRRGSRP